MKGLVAVSAVAKTATDSDALSTTLLLLGPQKGATVLESVAGASAIWILPSGKVEKLPSGPGAPFVRDRSEQVATSGSAAK
jgi:thiamine biosynthesis lipoprotein ApbE